MNYKEFLKTKEKSFISSGFKINEDELNKQQIFKKIITLDNAMVFDHPVIFFGDKRLQ